MVHVWTCNLTSLGVTSVLAKKHPAIRAEARVEANPSLKPNPSNKYFFSTSADNAKLSTILSGRTMIPSPGPPDGRYKETGHAIRLCDILCVVIQDNQHPDK